VIRGVVAEAEAAPEELSSIANVMIAPPMPFIPAEHHGRPIVMALVVDAGEVEAGQRVLAPFRAGHADCRPGAADEVPRDLHAG